MIKDSDPARHFIIMTLQNQPLNDAQKFILIISAFVLPPLAIGLLNSRCNMKRELVVSIILICFGFFPSTVFTIYCILYQFPRNLAESGGYVSLDEEAAPQQVQEPVASSLDAPPQYESIVPSAQDSKPSDNKVQQ